MKDTIWRKTFKKRIIKTNKEYSHTISTCNAEGTAITVGDMSYSFIQY